MRRLFLVMLATGCFLPPVTPKAHLRLEGKSHLANCINTGGDVKECLRENAAWCRSVGLENSCGADEFWPKR